MTPPSPKPTHLRHLIVPTRHLPTPHRTRPIPNATSRTSPPSTPGRKHSSAQLRHLHDLPRRATQLLATAAINNTRLTVAATAKNMSTAAAATDPHAASTPSQDASTHPAATPNHVAAADAGRPHPPASAAAASPASLPNDNNNHSAQHLSAATTAATTAPTNALPALPAASSDGDGTAGSTTTTTLQVDGKAVILDHLGPMVVGRDGTVSRIANWDELSEIERRNTLRVLGKRNQVRLAALRGEEAAGKGNGVGGGEAA